MKIEQQVQPENSAQSLLMARLQAEVNHPADIDAATDRLGISPFLINPYLATTVDMSFIGLGRGVNLPIQITARQGGRRSLYFLRPGEKLDETSLAARFDVSRTPVREALGQLSAMGLVERRPNRGALRPCCRCGFGLSRGRNARGRSRRGRFAGALCRASRLRSRW